MKAEPASLVVVLAALALACGGLATSVSGNGGSGGTSGGGSGGTTGGGGSGSAGGGGTAGMGGGGTAGSGPTDASADDGPSPVHDAAVPSLDAALASLDAAPSSLAGFALIVNDVAQRPMTCPSEDWEFPLPPGEGSPKPAPPVSGVRSAYIVNTGTLPMAYLAQTLWDYGTQYVPGVLTGGPLQLAGVLAPGAKVNITSVYVGDTVALLGSSEPFSNPDAGIYVGDEGTIPWPAGVSGSGGATTMYIAEIEVADSDPSTCTAPYHAW